MVKKISILFFLTFIFLGILAQKGLRFSVFANPCINWLESNEKYVASEGATIGFDAGLTVDNYFAENYAFTSGVSIGSLGGKLKYANATDFNPTSGNVSTLPGSTVKYNLQYINIPTGLKFKTREIGYFTYFAHLGLASQMNIKAKASTNEVANPALDGDNIKENISFFNMAYFFGAGVHYSIGGNTALVFGLTYSNGFLDITSHNDDNITSKNLAIRLGILF